MMEKSDTGDLIRHADGMTNEEHAISPTGEGQERTGEGLKRCPFCGSRPRMTKTKMMHMYGIACRCGTMIFYGAEKSERKTIEAWNRRAPEEEEQSS